MFTVTMKVAWQPFLCFYLSKPLNLRLIAYLTNMTSIHITTMLPMIPLLHFRLPTLPTWPALLAAKRLSTLPPSWASWWHFITNFETFLYHKLWASWCHFITVLTLKLSYGQVGVTLSLSLKPSLSNFPLCSAGAPPGANGHPVPITYEGFTLLTDNYNNYFMSSFIPQVPPNTERQPPKICSPVQLLPDPRLPNEPLPASANFWLDASWQTILEVRASTGSNFWLQNHLDQKMQWCDQLFSTALPSDATIWGSQVGQDQNFSFCPGCW